MGPRDPLLRCALLSVAACEGRLLRDYTIWRHDADVMPTDCSAARRGMLPHHALHSDLGPHASRLALSRIRGGMATSETFEFKAEIGQLMSLIINTFYSNKEIFLRELISNAADAIDKARHAALNDPAVLEAEPNLHISLIPEAEANTLTIVDTGVGMTRDELQQNLGTIAHSGTKAFMDAMRKTPSEELPLIGQFGVGFYSAFLVADRVEVFSKHSSEDAVWKWSSDAAGSYTIEQSEYDGLLRGTAIVLHLKDGQQELLSRAKLTELVKLHSEFITHPIRLKQPAPPPPPPPPAAKAEESTARGGGVETAGVDASAETGDAAEADVEDGGVRIEDVPAESEGAVGGAAEPTMEWATLNDQPPIWMQPASELTDEDYAGFYKSISNDWEPPLAHKHFTVEGQVDMRGLLFIPRRAPFDIFERQKRGHQLRLYVRRVLVAAECEELCPEWLSFLQGVVDSDDLPLNVSREMLQQSKALLRMMHKNIVKKAIEMLNTLAEDDEVYRSFYAQYSKNIKLGVHEDEQNRQKIARLLRYSSSASGANETSLAEYVSRLPEGQESIYYIAGESLEAVRDSPFVEQLQARGLEVLYMLEPIDEYVMQALQEFDGKRFVCITKAGFKLDRAEGASEPSAEEQSLLEALCNRTQALLLGQVHKVVLSERLAQSPSVLVTDEFGWSANMERIMRAQALRDPTSASLMSARKTLELNPRHPIVLALAARVASASTNPEDARSLEEALRLLYEAALIGSGFALEQPNAFTARLYRMLAASLGADTARPSVAVGDDGAGLATAGQQPAAQPP